MAKVCFLAVHSDAFFGSFLVAMQQHIPGSSIEWLLSQTNGSCSTSILMRLCARLFLFSYALYPTAVPLRSLEKQRTAVKENSRKSSDNSTRKHLHRIQKVLKYSVRLLHRSRFGKLHRVKLARGNAQAPQAGSCSVFSFHSSLIQTIRGQPENVARRCCLSACHWPVVEASDGGVVLAEDSWSRSLEFYTDNMTTYTASGPSWPVPLPPLWEEHAEGEQVSGASLKLLGEVQYLLNLQSTLVFEGYSMSEEMVLSKVGKSGCRFLFLWLLFARPQVLMGKLCLFASL
jgi:hypothetical protein